MDRRQGMRVVHRGLFVSIAVLLLAAGIAVAATEDDGRAAADREQAAPRRSTTTTESTTTTAPLVLDTSSTTAAPPTTAAGPAPAPTTTTSPAELDPTPTEPGPQPPAPPPESGACGAPMQKANGSPWECSFADDFDKGYLDRNVWQVQQTKYGGYHSGSECFVDSPNNVSVTSDTLRLTVRTEPRAFTCAGALSIYRTQWTSGMVSSIFSFTQTYGRFEFRARVSNPGVRGLHSAFWLYPREKTYGNWPKSGEIDVAEIYSMWPDKAVPYVHYQGDDDDPDKTTTDCVVGDVGEYHTYAVEWTPDAMTFIYDGNVCLVNVWHPWAPLRHPQPFDKPFYVSMTQALGTGYNNFTIDTTPLPATTEIDYVRVWK